MMVFGRYEAQPSQECEAYNNMKHTSNTHHVMLKMAQSYTILKDHKGQKLILVKGEQPGQRWVDAVCFTKKTNQDDVAVVKSEIASIVPKVTLSNLSSSKQNLLALSWQNAFCETHKYKKECKNSSKYNQSHFVLHGLWPQPRNNLYCDVSKKEIGNDKNRQWSRIADLTLTPQTRQKLQSVMPGYQSNLHKHEWIKHGTCYGKKSEAYYTDAIALVEQINKSEVGKFFSENMGKNVTLKEVRKHFDKVFGMGTGQQVELRCKKGLITELWIHLGAGSNNLKASLSAGEKVRGRCQRALIDQP